MSKFIVIQTKLESCFCFVCLFVYIYFFRFNFKQCNMKKYHNFDKFNSGKQYYQQKTLQDLIETYTNTKHTCIQTIIRPDLCSDETKNSKLHYSLVTRYLTSQLGDGITIPISNILDIKHREIQF